MSIAIGTSTLSYHTNICQAACDWESKLFWIPTRDFVLQIELQIQNLDAHFKKKTKKSRKQAKNQENI